MAKKSQKYKKAQALVENGGVSVADAHQQIAERTVDVLTTTLQISNTYQILSNTVNINQISVKCSKYLPLFICEIYVIYIYKKAVSGTDHVTSVTQKN